MLRDARSLDHATLEEMRRQAIERIQAGEPLCAIANDLQVHPNTVSKWNRRFRRGGLRMLARTKAVEALECEPNA
jgi:transposase-like protein